MTVRALIWLTAVCLGLPHVWAGSCCCARARAQQVAQQSAPASIEPGVAGEAPHCPLCASRGGEATASSSRGAPEATRSTATPSKERRTPCDCKNCGCKATQPLIARSRQAAPVFAPVVVGAPETVPVWTPVEPVDGPLRPPQA